MIKVNPSLSSTLVQDRRSVTQFDSLPLGLLNSAGVEGNEKSTGDGGGAGVSLILSVLRDATLEALKAALTS
jgi:hypothetical protein